MYDIQVYLSETTQTAFFSEQLGFQNLQHISIHTFADLDLASKKSWCHKFNAQICTIKQCITVILWLTDCAKITLTFIL